MLVKDVLARAGVIAGLNDFSGASIDQNYNETAKAFLEQTISDINNDTQFATKTVLLDFQAGTGAQPLGKSYNLPAGTRRILRAFSGNMELRKTDFSTVALQDGSATGFFAINGGKLWLTQILPVKIAYVPEVKLGNIDSELDVEGELDVEAEYLPYITNQLAHNLALSFSTATVETCARLAANSYNALLDNKRAEQGSIYVNPYASLNRFGFGMIG